MVNTFCSRLGYISLLLFISHFAKSQTTPCNDTSMIKGTIDMISRTNNFCNKCVPKNKCYGIKVINMNPLLYTLNYTTTDIIAPKETNDNLLEKLIGNFDKTVKTPSTDSLKIDSSQKFAPDAKRMRNLCEEFLIAAYIFNGKINTYKAAAEKIKKFLDFCQRLENLCLDSKSTQEKIEKDIIGDGQLVKYKAENKILDLSSSSISQHSAKLVDEFKAKFDELKNAHIDLQNQFKKCEKAADSENSGINFVKMNSLKKELESVFDGIKAVIDKFKESEISEVGTRVANYYTVVTTPHSFTRCISISCGDIDSSKTVVNFYRLNDTAQKTIIYSAKLDLRIKGGMRNFRSPGLMLNFGGVRDDRFFLDKDSVVREESSRNKGFPSLAYMENFYWRSCKDLAGGFSFGLAANLNNITELTSLRFFLGPSLFIGEKSRFLISSGVTGGFSDRLIGKFEKDVKIDADIYKKEGEKLVSKNWNYGFYIGISYKIFN